MECMKHILRESNKKQVLLALFQLEMHAELSHLGQNCYVEARTCGILCIPYSALTVTNVLLP